MRPGKFLYFKTLSLPELANFPKKKETKLNTAFPILMTNPEFLWFCIWNFLTECYYQYCNWTIVQVSVLYLPSSLNYYDGGDSCLILPHWSCYQCGYTNAHFSSLLVAALGVVCSTDTSGVWGLNPLGPPTQKHELMVMRFRWKPFTKLPVFLLQCIMQIICNHSIITFWHLYKWVCSLYCCSLFILDSFNSY